MEKEIKQLTLSRCYGEAIQVEGPCVITIREAKGRRVSMTFQATDEVKIRRLELVPDEERIAGDLDLSGLELKVKTPRADKSSAPAKQNASAAAPVPFRLAGVKAPGHRMG